MFLFKILFTLFISYQIFVPSNCLENVSLKRDYIMKIFIHKKSNEKIQTKILSNEIVSSEAVKEQPKTFIDYYYDGVRMYLNNDWKLCITLIERSLMMYHEYYESITTCRIRCENERKNYVPQHAEDFDNRHFYESLLYKTLCLERCKKTTLPDLPRYFMFVGKDREIFKTRKPYEYLQICYYRDKENEKAFSASYTALIGDPNNNVLKKNLEYYSKLQGFDFEKLRDLEDKRYSGFFDEALDKYEKEEWEHAIELFEISIDLWMQELEKCRAFCEGEYNHGWLPDFTTSVSNHYVYSLRCKRNCTLELSLINGRYHENLLPDMYDHLQYAFYKHGNLKEACKCVTSYLLFLPESEVMLFNKKFYEGLPDVRDEYFEPYPEAKTIFHRSFYELDLVRNIDEAFTQFLEEDEQIKNKVEVDSKDKSTNNTVESNIN